MNREKLVMCEHPISRIKMSGECLDCGAVVREPDCDCGICQICNGCPDYILDATTIEEAEL